MLLKWKEKVFKILLCCFFFFLIKINYLCHWIKNQTEEAIFFFVIRTSQHLTYSQCLCQLQIFKKICSESWVKNEFAVQKWICVHIDPSGKRSFRSISNEFTSRLWTSKCDCFCLHIFVRSGHSTKRIHFDCLLLEKNNALVLPFAHHLLDPGQLCGHFEPVSGRDCEQTKMRVS